MEFIFFNQAGQTLFTRSDMESGHWVQHEMSVNAVFPFDPGKVIQRGQRIAFRDPATDNLEVFEIRQVSTIEPDHYQQFSAEQIALSELSDEHIDRTEITDKTAAQALTAALAGTLWQVGTDTSSGTQSADFARGSVWQAVNTIKANWNVYITPRVVVSAAGVITGKYLDISPAGGVWRGVRLSVRKNLPDPTVTYNDEEVLTALYGYGGTVNNAEVTFKDEVWTATADHPAKPANQTYLEWPEKTALYGRNGRPRYGYYQNANITSPSVLLQKTWEALQRTAEPKIRIAGSAADLSRLGYADQPLRLHDLAIVEIAETGEVFRKEIIMLDVDLVDPTENQLEIGDYIPNIVYINRETAQRASGGGGGGGRGQTANEAEQSETFAEFAKTNDMIGMVVGTRNGGYYVKAGEIVLAINGQTGQSTIKLAADVIDIDGIITSLEAKDIGVGGLNVEGLAYFHRNVDFEANIIVENKITCYGFEVDEGSFTAFGHNATWQSKTVVTSVNVTNPISVETTYGTTVTFRGLDTSNSRTTATIHYLGY
jgi:phage minor structural protein